MAESPRNPFETSVWIIIALAAALNLMRPFFPDLVQLTPSDFAQFWQAGVFWTEGRSPYADVYAQTVLVEGFKTHPFFYPPHLRFLFQPLGYLPFEAARLAFVVFNVALWAGIAWSVSRRLPGGFSPLAAFTLTFAAASFALNHVRISVELGSTLGLLVAGAALLHEGVLRRRTSLTAAGLVLLFLKPPLGVAALAVLVFQRNQWRGMTYGMAALGALCLVGCDFAVIDSLTSYLANVTAYRDYPQNSDLLSTGLGAVLAALGAPFPATALLGPVLAACAAIGYVARSSPERALFASFAVLVFFTPGHGFDFTVLVPFIPLALSLSPKPLLPVAGLLALFQISAISKVLVSYGIDPFREDAIRTLGDGGLSFLALATFIETLAYGGVTALAIVLALRTGGIVRSGPRVSRRMDSPQAL
ncbi:MAG: glycosyltransferase family 87 protein [Pseudomonadota bacterium]